MGIARGNGRGAALVCNREGRILEVLHADSNLIELLRPGVLLTSLVDHDSISMAGRFIDELCSFGTAVGWELGLVLNKQSQPFQFLGCCHGAIAVVVATMSEPEFHHLFEQLSGRWTLPGAKSSPSQEPPQHEHTSQRQGEVAALIDELMRVGSTLAGTQPVPRKRPPSDKRYESWRGRHRLRRSAVPGLDLAMEQLPGKVLDGRYLLAEMIGSGGSSVVFRATHLGLSRPVAVKIFLPANPLNSREALKLFREEGPSASRITHPNVVAVLDAGTSLDGIAYIVMELLNGYTLGEVLGSHRQIPIQRCIQIIKSVCLALIEAHDAGIVHRDIKPDNIFLHQSAAGECVKLLDFGIAKVFDGSQPHPDAVPPPPGGIIGTPDYMPPEQIRGAACDGRSDVYSLAVLLYEMLCGQVPFLRRYEGAVSWIHEHLNKEPLPLVERNPAIPKNLADTIQSALAKDSRRRPTAREFLAQIMAAVPSLTHDKSELAQSPVRSSPSFEREMDRSDNRSEELAATQRKAAISRTQPMSHERFDSAVSHKNPTP